MTSGYHRLDPVPGRSIPRAGQTPELRGLSYAGELREFREVENLELMEPGHLGLQLRMGTAEIGPVPANNLWRIHHVCIESNTAGGHVDVYMDEPSLAHHFADFPCLLTAAQHLGPVIEIRSGQSIIFVVTAVPMDGTDPTQEDAVQEIMVGINGQIYLDNA